MEVNPFVVAVIVASELASLFLIWKLWKSDEYLILKIPMTIIGLVPVFGPFAILWIVGMPTVKHRALQNRSNTYVPTLEVFDRWRSALDEKDEQERRRKTRDLLSQKYDD